MTTVVTWLALWAVIATIVALAEAVVWWALARAHAREIAEWRAMPDRVNAVWLATLEKMGNVRDLGTPTPPPVTVSREIDAEERVQRMVSEDTIQRGMQQIRAMYSAANMRPPEDDVLRSEAISMLGGNEPVIETDTLPRA
jgi:hypothetical protein